MKKLLFLFTYIIYSLFTIHFSLASSVPVEQVFSDINKDYKYYNELQDLYNRWIISPDENWEFNPQKLLTRQEFVGIASESTCKKCIKPNTDIEFIQKYNTEPFFDVFQDNKYFYCIANAKENNFVQWYDIWDACDDWTQKSWEIPFCINNNITLEEALAVILRMSWILTASEAEEFRQRIRSWENFPDLALDVKARNEDWSVYSFYPDFHKALNYEIVEYDKNWEMLKYNLLEKNGDYLRPDKFISKEEFLKIAYLTLKANSCTHVERKNMALKMIIFDKSCDSSTNNCTLSDLEDETDTYDFWLETYWTCELWIDDPSWYIWTFYNTNTHEEINKYGKYLDNYEFLTDWIWIITLVVIDKCWNTWKVYNIISVDSSNLNINLNVSIKANPIYWPWPMEVNFSPIIKWWTWPYVSKWQFWDWSIWNGNNINYIYKMEGVYEVILTVTDSKWLTWEASVLIQVISSINCELDSDNDFVNDCIDKCPLVKWEVTNSWCPVFEKICTNTCDKWYTCTDSWFCVPDQYWSNLSACLSSQINTGYIYANSLNQECFQCPCVNSLDFTSIIRTCDLLFPAIVSPDGRYIYGKGDLYEVK